MRSECSEIVAFIGNSMLLRGPSVKVNISTLCPHLRIQSGIRAAGEMPTFHLFLYRYQYSLEEGCTCATHWPRCLSSELHLLLVITGPHADQSRPCQHQVGSVGESIQQEHVQGSTIPILASGSVLPLPQIRAPSFLQRSPASTAFSHALCLRQNLELS